MDLTRNGLVLCASDISAGDAAGPSGSHLGGSHCVPGWHYCSRHHPRVTQDIHPLLYSQSQVEFLGKLVSGSGIAISPDKLEAVKQWPVPSNVKELFLFLGFMNYHRNLIPNFD